MTDQPTCRTGKLPYASAQDAAKAARHVEHRGKASPWHKGKLQHGVIYAPCTQDLYVATRGGGAVLNNRKIRVSKTTVLDESLVGTGVPIKAGARLDEYVPQLRAVVEKTAGVRRAGSAALDLAYVACGRLDAFWELGLNSWDMAAGVLLVQEAGGVVSELYGGDDPLKTGNVLAANTKMHEQLAPLLRSAKPTS